MSLAPPPTRSEFLGNPPKPAKQGENTPSWPWLRWHQETTVQVNHPASTSTVPASANATADGGEMAHDANYLYIAVGKNSWKRVALNAF